MRLISNGDNINTENKLIEGGKEEAKKVIMKKAKPIIIKVSAIVIMILMAGALLLGVFNAVGDTVQNIVDSIVAFFTIDSEGAIVVSDEQVDTIINSISELGVSIDGLKLMGDVDYDNPDIQAENTEALRKYIKEFFEAQAMTQTINTNPGWFEEHITNGGKPYGTVYLHRTNGEDTVENTDSNQLTYISYDEMVKKQESKDKNITKYYSIDEEGKLVIAGWSTTIVKKNGKVDTSETIITLKHISYKSVISQYTTPMSFFLYLTMVTQNPEFVSAVTDLVKQSDIRLTVLYSEGTYVNSEKYTYVENTKTRRKKENLNEIEDINIIEDLNEINEIANSNQDEFEEVITSITKEEIIETTTKVMSPTIQVTYAKTWFSEQTITYNKKEEKTEIGPSITIPEPESEEEPEIKGEGSVTWKTSQKIEYSSTSNTTTYEEGTRGDVIDKTGEKGDGEESFIGLLDTEFKIPNSTRYVAAGGNLVSGAEMFFYFLQKNSETQNLEMVMRYILYKYTGRDYGVTELNFNIFNAKKFITIGSSGSKLLVEYIHTWENASGAPTNEDGTKYIIYTDGYGNPTVGYGIDIFNGGYASLFQQAGYPTNVGGEVDKEFVDALEEQTIQLKIESIKAATTGLDLKEYQIHALVSRAYNCGTSGAILVTRGSPSLNFVDSYKKYWNSEEDDQYEDRDNNANFNHKLYTQYMSKPVTSKGEYVYGLERRRKSEWILFQTGYYDVLDKWYKEGSTILEVADAIHKYMEEYQYTYCVYNCNKGEECPKYGKQHGLNTTFEKSKTGHHNTCCATYVSWVLQEAGYITEEEHTNGAGQIRNLLVSKGWIQITSVSELEPGDVLYYQGHVEIYAGDGKVYNAGSGYSIRGASPAGNGIKSLVCGLRAPY